ncbi:MAG: hypothetical protein QOF77_1613 [Solirubrobacteraceae bacterium]|jgi:hypothetical protein|nr:hypothetical protein [Solirubrobacteraceae bacterium]
MPGDESTPAASSSWEEELKKKTDPEERHEYAKTVIHEPLAEAAKRAKRVAELEKEQGGENHHAATTAELIQPILGMWHH